MPQRQPITMVREAIHIIRRVLAVYLPHLRPMTDDVIPQIEGMIAAGVNHIAFGHCLGPDFDEALDLLGREVLPHFRK
jgi:hypothetical protein